MRFSDEAVLRLLVAVVLGAVIGAEREATDQPAGLRTHIAICLGAAVFGVVSTLGFTEFEARRASTNFQVDVTRVASQVVVGIGFLGAGVIFRERTVVKNLTTAASMWVTSAIGLMAGVGDLGTAAAATGILFLVLVALRPMRTFLQRRVTHPSRELEARLVSDGSVGEFLEAARSDGRVVVDAVNIGKVSGCPTVTFRMTSDPGTNLDEHVALLVARPEVTHLGTTVDVHS